MLWMQHCSMLSTVFFSSVTSECMSNVAQDDNPRIFGHLFVHSLIQAY